jgi:ABC-2 type transport system permease protein
MRNVGIIMRRELASYFATPLAYVFILIFLVLANAFTFYLGGFYERGQADLEPFFTFHPWLYLFLIPAVSMKLWAEERNSGTIELLMTQPVRLWDAVLGKYLAAWIFVALALALTFPLWITVNYLGHPDNGAILAAYLGSLLLAGGFLAIGSCMSAVTRSQVVAFILGVVTCFVFTLAGFPLVLDAVRGAIQWVAGWLGSASAWSAQPLIDAIASLSFLTHFQSIEKGVIDVRDLLYFGMLIGFFLLATGIALELRKAD